MIFSTSFWLSQIQVTHNDKKRLFRYQLHKLIWNSFQDLPSKTKQPFLFSITDQADQNGIYCFVQSKIELDWLKIFDSNPHSKIRLSIPAKSKFITIPTNKNTIYSFNFEASPVKNVYQGHNKRGIKTPMLHMKDIENWLLNTSNSNGFSLLQFEMYSRKILVRKSDIINAKDIALSSCKINGVLKIDRPEAFSNALLTGLGPKKSFGFGMIKLSKNSLSM